MNNLNHQKKEHFSILPLTFFSVILIMLIAIIYHINNRDYYNPVDIANNLNNKNYSHIDNGLNFAFAGDYGANKNTEKVFSLINNLKPDFHIVLGDLSYNEVKPESAWCNLVRKFVPETPIVLLSGNHESNGKDGDIDRFANCLPFSLPVKIIGDYTKDYYFDYPRENPLARFIMISPDITFRDGKLKYIKNSDLLNNLVKNIEEAKTKKIPWIIVGAHKPCLSTEILHHCETGIDLPKEIIDKGVDLYMNGHSHIYQRTFMLSCIDDKNVNSDCINKGYNSIFEKGRGTIFVTNGVGGVEVRATDKDSKIWPYFASTHSEDLDPVFGVSMVSLNKDYLELKFIDADSGKIIDQFKIQNNGSN